MHAERGHRQVTWTAPGECPCHWTVVVGREVARGGSNRQPSDLQLCGNLFRLNHVHPWLLLSAMPET